MSAQQYDETKVYLLKGKTLNAILKAIETNKPLSGAEIAVEVRPDEGTRVNVSGSGISWRSVTDCDGNTFDVMSRTGAA